MLDFYYMYYIYYMFYKGDCKFSLFYKELCNEFFYIWVS